MLKRILSRQCSNIMSFYAVRIGRKPGIYNTWSECESQVKGFNQAKYKKFKTKDEAQSFVEEANHNPRENISTVLGVHRERVFKAKDAISASSSRQTKFLTDVAALRHEFVVREKLPTAPVVYSDGCCRGNGQHSAYGGVGVYWAPFHHKNISERLNIPKPTNQKAELIAACRALESAIEMGLPEVELRTDSIYTIKAMTEWIHNWKLNDWKRTCGSDVVNKDEMLRLSALCRKISVIWVHVRGHEGIYGNEQADKLANEGALMTNT